MMNMSVDENLVKEIGKAINGEYSAISCYTKLMEKAPTKKEKNTISEIRDDEIRHFHEFSALYMLMANRQPEPKINEQCPDDYRAGLRFAFEDEQHTVDFYHEIADRAQHPYVQHLFRRAAADEQNHAVWFLS